MEKGIELCRKKKLKKQNIQNIPKRYVFLSFIFHFQLLSSFPLKYSMHFDESVVYEGRKYAQIKKIFHLFCFGTKRENKWKKSKFPKKNFSKLCIGQFIDSMIKIIDRTYFIFSVRLLLIIFFHLFLVKFVCDCVFVFFVPFFSYNLCIK